MNMISAVDYEAFYNTWTDDFEKDAKEKLKAKGYLPKHLPSQQLQADKYIAMWEVLAKKLNLNDFQVVYLQNEQAGSLYQLPTATVTPSPATTTPARSSRNITKSNELEASLNILVSSGIRVVIGGKMYSGNESIVTLLSAAAVVEEPLPQLTEYMGIGSPTELPTSLIHIGRLLSQKKELYVQTMINNHLLFLNAANTSSCSDQLPSRPRKLDMHENIYPATAKPDLTSKIAPLILEIKDSPDTKGTELLDNCKAVLVQGIDHAHVLRSTDASLKHFAIMCVTGRSAWLLWFERAIENFSEVGKQFETVSITRIAHDNVWRYWCAFNNWTRKDPFWYLTEDGPFLRSTLSSITSVKLCATKIMAKSQHRVYGISLPQIVRYRINGTICKSVIGTTLLKHDLCVKVICGEREFQSEASIASKVAMKYNAMYQADNRPKSIHHLIGTHKVRRHEEIDALTQEFEEFVFEGRTTDAAKGIHLLINDFVYMCSLTGFLLQTVRSMRRPRVQTANLSIFCTRRTPSRPRTPQASTRT